jgi:arginine deiminase
VTNKGLVVSRMGSLQRRNETKIMKFCFKKLNIDPLGEIDGTGLLEGGDFYPLGEDLCLLGVGKNNKIKNRIKNKSRCCRSNDGKRLVWYKKSSIS